MIASIQITNTDIFAFRAVLLFKLLSRKVLFMNRKDNRNCYKVDYCRRDIGIETRCGPRG